MNKKIIILLYLLFTTVLLGCSNAEQISMDTTSRLNTNKNIKYTVEQIYFSKSFQSISPSVEVSEVNGKKKVSLNLGLSEYSEISIDDMKLEGDQFNIYISGHKDKSTSSLSVPQIILELKDNSFENIKDMDFNIVYNNYDYIDIKFKINDVLNKLESQFKLTLNSCPKFNLIEKNDKFIWEITYNNIVSREDEDYPLINLSANVDANTGEVLNFKKENISSLIDTGNILDFNNTNGFLYEKMVDNKGEESRSELWFFDSITKEKTMIYNCHFSIPSAAISEDLSHIAFIEKTDTSSEAYIYSKIDDKIFKLHFEDDFNPQVIRWKTNDLLYLLENKNNTSSIYSYDLKSNNIDLIANTNKNITNIVAGSDGFIVAEYIEQTPNKKLSFTKDFNKYKTINNGFNAKFINTSTIAYLKNDEKVDLDYLILYDLEEEKIISKIKDNVIAYRPGSSDNIIYLKNNPKYKDFTLASYSLNSKESTDIIDIIDQNVYYNDKDNLVYLNFGLAVDDNVLNMIYSIKVN